MNGVMCGCGRKCDWGCVASARLRRLVGLALLGLLVALCFVATRATGGEAAVVEVPSYDSAALYGDDLEAEFVALQPIEDRDAFCAGFIWILDDANRDEVKRETVETRTEETVTVVDPETGAESTETVVTVSPTVVETVEEGEEYDGAGVYAGYRLWEVAGEHFTLSLDGIGATNAEDVEKWWGGAHASLTFNGAETDGWRFFSWSVGAALLLEEEALWGLTFGMPL